MEASNLKELKDAATELMRFTCNSCEHRPEDGRSVHPPCSVITRMRNALSANPIRNCDVGTAEEQAERQKAYCRKHFTPDQFGGNCRKCPLKDRRGWSCQLAWAQMPYAEEGGEK